MTQAGRQGSPRNSSGRNNPQRNTSQGGKSAGGFRGGAPKRGGGFGSDRPHPSRARSASSIRIWLRTAPSRAEAPLIQRPPGLPRGSLPRASPEPRRRRALQAPSSRSRAPGHPAPQPPVRSAANASARTWGRCAGRHGRRARAATFPSRNCTTPTACACRRSWPRPASPRAASARR